MESLALGSWEVHASRLFWKRVALLRAKIIWLWLKSKVWQSISPEEIQDYQLIAQEKIANILEYTLRENKKIIHRDIIETVVQQEFDRLPIESEIDFVNLLEGKRVKNPAIRVWIGTLVNKVLERS